MSGPAIETRPRPATGRTALLMSLTLLCALGMALAYLFLTAKAAPSVPLGAAAFVPGGMAGISEIVPLEVDGWAPPRDQSPLSGKPPEGTHRVRLVVRITALESEGVQLDARDFTVSGLGSFTAQPVWSSEANMVLRQGESLAATLVFELPDKAVALILEGPGDSRLSMGLAHHRG
ncbi:MAG: hypothetical protein JWO49_825 [Arthrobacter sp.]|nr:hypothetical protein [Arthrobacter sp.]